MMREDDDGSHNNNNDAEKGSKNPLRWTARSARRMQLAVRASITSSVATRATFLEDDESSEVISISTGDDNANIDQAMLGLYCLPEETLFSERSLLLERADSSCSSFGRRRQSSSRDLYDVSSLMNQSSSYIPQDDWDPMLDGGFRDVTEEDRTRELTQALTKYELSPDWQRALARENMDNSRNDNDDDEPCNDGDDDEFGDFQSADGTRHDEKETAESVAPDAAAPKSPSTDEREPRVEFVLHTPPPSSSKHPQEDERSIGSGTTFNTIGTVGLVKRVDDLFSANSSIDDHDLCTTLSNDVSTPALLAQTQDILERAARETEEGDPASSSEDDEDSDATPRSRRRVSYSTPSRQLSKEFAASKRITMQLPVNDLTTIDGRWTRRRQMEHQATLNHDKDVQKQSSLESLKELLDDLPELYQISLDRLDDGPVEANAATLRVLNSVPWGCVHLDEPVGSPVEHDLSVWDDFIAGELSQLDSTLEGVQKIMAASVKPEKLDEANNLVHACEQNLRLARIYWDRSSRSLEAAVAADSDGSFNGEGILGNAHLLELWQQKEDFSGLHGLLERLNSVMAQEEEITRRIDTFDAKHSRAQDEYLNVVRLGKRLRETINGDLGSLDCLSELRDSRLTSILEERFWNRLRLLSQQSIVRVCRKQGVPSIEYESLVQAAFGLFEASRSKGDHSNAMELRDDFHAKFDEESGWSKNMVEAMLYEAERCFAIALLEPLDAEDSAFVKDLRSLEHEIGTDWGDSAKLKTLTHNLVTIRFDFERSLCYLPWVMVRLCEGLLDVLRGHVLFHQLHGCAHAGVDGDENSVFVTPHGTAFLSSVADGLENAQNILWDKCESIMVHALKEYHNFASKTNMFETERGKVDDSVWERELQGLHTVYSAISCFMGFRSAFFGCDLSYGDNSKVEQSKVFHALEEIAADHLKIVHIEAMTSMGRLLSRETWHLVNLNNPDESEKKCDWSTTSFSSKQILSSSFESAVQRRKGLATFFSLTPDNVFERFGESPRCDSPFLRPRQAILFDSVNTLRSVPPEGDTSEGMIHRVYDSIDSAINASIDDPYRIATQSIIDGLVEWVARLVNVSFKVPLVSEQVCASMENLFDLYFTTVFRLCAGSRRNERIILGVDTSTAAFDASPVSHSVSRKRGSSPPAILRSFGQERKPTGKPPAIPFRMNVTISSTLDIEMCAPMPADLKDTEKARRFIDRAQQELHGNVNLNRVDSWIGNQNAQDDPEEYACAASKIIERREIAAWSCLVVAGIADITLTTMSRRLAEEPGGPSNVKRLQDYVQSAAEAITVLFRKSSEVSCTRALSPFGFVREIVQVGGEWEESKLHEQPNDYVESLCERVCLVWGFVAASGKLPQHLVAQVWARMQTAAYMTLLEGFSRVIYCSTEGRALMALDLASVSSNMRRDAVFERLESFDLPFTPPPVSPRHGKQYVDLYIKVYYYPQEDVLGWISNNCRYYRMNHMLALLSSSGFAGRSEQSRELFEKVKKLYETEQI